MKKWIIKNLGLKGSWAWAKRQMMNGEMVRCKHWTGALKLRARLDDLGDGRKNSLLQCNFTRRNSPLLNGGPLWETSNHHLSYEDYTDYEIYKWP